MKILFVHQNFPGQYKYLAPALAQQGHEVTALGMAERPSMPGIRYVRYGVQRTSSKTTHPFAHDFETKVIRGEACLRAAAQLAHQGYTPDLICAHPGWGEPLFLKELWPHTRQLHYLEFYYRSTGQDVGFDPEFGKTVLSVQARLVAKNANNLLNLSLMDAGICPTHWQFSTLPTEYQAKVQVIHDGIDAQTVRPDPMATVTLIDDQNRSLTLTPRDKVITYVGRNLEPFRGYHQFMRALPIVLRQHPTAKVVIIGGDGVSYGAPPPSGTWKAQFLNEVTGQIDMSRVHFVGHLPYNKFIQTLQCSTVHTYLTYPFVLSWSLLEAMSLGATVVASDTAPVKEVIQHGENGWLVDFFQPESLANQIIECLNDTSRQLKIKQAARETVLSRYDLTTHCLPQQMAWIQALLAQG